MPTADVIARFLVGAQDQLQKPIRAYFDVVERFGADSIQATIAAPLTRAEMERTLRNVHIQAGLIASAGNPTPGQLRELQALIGSDERYLRGFMDALPKLSREQALVRTNMYAATAKNTVAQVETVDIPLPIRPRDGQTECTWHCRCALNIVYLFGAGNYNVFWLLDQTGGVEHCADCLRLARVWRPLRIRNGQIVGSKMISDHDFAHLKHALMRAA